MKQNIHQKNGSSGCTQINGNQIKFLSTTTVHSIPPKLQLKLGCFWEQPTNNPDYKTEMNNSKRSQKFSTLSTPTTTSTPNEPEFQVKDKQGA